MPKHLLPETFFWGKKRAEIRKKRKKGIYKLAIVTLRMNGRYLFVYTFAHFPIETLITFSNLPTPYFSANKIFEQGYEKEQSHFLMWEPSFIYEHNSAPLP